MSTNILRVYAAIFAFRYLCLLPPIFHIDKMTCCPVSCPVSCLFSITKFGFIFSELRILFLKSDILFFQKQQLNKFIFTGTLPGLKTDLLHRGFRRNQINFFWWFAAITMIIIKILLIDASFIQRQIPLCLETKAHQHVFLCHSDQRRRNISKSTLLAFNSYL